MYTELYHHGIKGQKWGVRRFQNPDGTRTSAGKKRERGEKSSHEGAKKALKVGATIAGAAAIGAIAYANRDKLNEMGMNPAAAAQKAKELKENLNNAKSAAKASMDLARDVRKADKAVVKERKAILNKRRLVSDADLDALINRMDKEKKLKQLMSEDQSSGEDFVTNYLSKSGKTALAAAVTGAGVYAGKVALSKKASGDEASKYIFPNPNQKKK